MNKIPIDVSNIKEDFWKYEKSIYSKEVYITSNGHINFNKKINELELNENSILLFRFKHFKKEFFVCKVTMNTYSYSIHLGVKILNKAKLEKNRHYILEIIKKLNLKIKDSSNKPEIKNSKLDLTSLIANDQIFFKRPHDWITIYSFPRKFITLPRYINLNNNLIWSIGFYFAEGNKKCAPFKICNNELSLLKKFKESIENHFKINEWDIENSRNKSLKLEKVKKSIYENLNLNNNKFYISEGRSKDAINGFTTIISPNIIFFRIFNSLIMDNRLHNFILQNKERTINFLRGMESGDGFVSLRYWKNNSKKMITVGVEMKNKELLMLINKYYESLYGTTKKQERKRNNRIYYRIYYENCKIIRELIINNHFLEHKKRRDRLVYGYSRKRFGESDFLYLNAIIKGKTTLDQIKSYLNYSSGGHNKLISMLNYNLIERKKNEGKYHYCLTKRGEYLYNELLKFN